MNKTYPLQREKEKATNKLNGLKSFETQVYY